MVSGVIWSKASPWPKVQRSSSPSTRTLGKAQRPTAHLRRGLLLTALTSPAPLACWLKSISKYADVVAPRVSGPCIARFTRVRPTKARNTSRLALFPPPGADVLGTRARLTDSPTGVSSCWTCRRREPPSLILKSLLEYTLPGISSPRNGGGPLLVCLAPAFRSKKLAMPASACETSSCCFWSESCCCSWSVRSTRSRSSWARRSCARSASCCWIIRFSASTCSRVDRSSSSMRCLSASTLWACAPVVVAAVNTNSMARWPSARLVDVACHPPDGKVSEAILRPRCDELDLLARARFSQKPPRKEVRVVGGEGKVAINAPLG